MDANAFDALLRSFARALPRRRGLRLVAGVGLAGLLGLDLQSSSAKKKRRKKRKKKGKKQTGGSQPPPPSLLPPPSPPSPPPPPSPRCPQPANPHFCPSANSCVPACPSGQVFDEASCTCGCVPRTCCSCRGGSAPFCSHSFPDYVSCETSCEQINPGHTGSSFFEAFHAGNTYTATCTAGPMGPGCAHTCQSHDCAGNDACQGAEGSCPGGGQCFQPLGGGPTRCGKPTATSSCGCTSHQQCADNHGAGSFCVSITGGACTCGGATAFCATPV